LILSTSGRQATDPKDYIYGNVPLALRSKKDPSDPVIVPDYANTIQVIYTEATNLIISSRQETNLIVYAQQAQSLDVLAEVNRVEGLPTWVPSYNHINGLFINPGNFRCMRQTPYSGRFLVPKLC